MDRGFFKRELNPEDDELDSKKCIARMEKIFPSMTGPRFCVADEASSRGDQRADREETINPGRIMTEPLTSLELIDFARNLNAQWLKLWLELLDTLLSNEDASKKAKAIFEATTSTHNTTISNLKAEVIAKSDKLAETQAKLRSSEAKLKQSAESQVQLKNKVEFLETELYKKEAEIGFLKFQGVVDSKDYKMHRNNKVESLEVELSRKQAEIGVLKNQVVASEQKASATKQKTLSLMGKLIQLSNLSAKAIEDLKKSVEFDDVGAADL